MKRISVVLFAVLCSVTINAQEARKVTPVLEIGAGLSVEANSGYGECVKGLATEFSFGLDWRIGALANVGLRDMLYQYPDVGITGHTHLFSLCFTAGYRF